jgi:hypothetical protein
MLLGCVAASLASAVPINGSITFAGGLTLGDSSNVATNNIGSATQVLSWVNGTVQSRSGAYSSIAVNSAVSLAAPWSFNYSGSPIVGFWSVGGFSFDLTSSFLVSNDGTFISAKGFGTLNGPSGYDATAGTWTFTTQSPDAEGIFSFSASSSVPDGGTTAVLLGVALLGVAAVARRRGTSAV